jgi:hypothetical protein
MSEVRSVQGRDHSEKLIFQEVRGNDKGLLLFDFEQHLSVFGRAFRPAATL